MVNISSEKPQAGKVQKSPYTKTERYALAGFVYGFTFPILATLIKLIQLRLSVSLSDIFALHQTEPLLWIIDSAPLFLGLLAGVAGRRQDILLKTNQKLLDREKDLTSLKGNFEQLLNDRTNELLQRNAQMRSSVYFTRQISGSQDMAALLKKTVDLISQQFGHYYTGLFLLDDEGKSAILQAASSEVGQQLLDRGYSVDRDERTIIGRVIEREKLYISQKGSGGADSDAGGSEFSETQSEIALPLIARGKVIGVLDIQSERSGAFDQNEAEVLQLLADQVAASIDNVRLLSKSQAFNSQLEILTAKQTQTTWREYLKDQKRAYRFTPVGVRTILPGSTPKNNNSLHIPLLLRGQEIGSITLQRKDMSDWSRSEHELAEKVSLQVALALDNSRLLEETRQHAVQEQTVNEISARLNRSLDVDTLLQTAVRELAALPEVSEASVFIRPSNEDKFNQQI
jgi:GAF domain-containing protein